MGKGRLLRQRRE